MERINHPPSAYEVLVVREYQQNIGGTRRRLENILNAIRNRSETTKEALIDARPWMEPGWYRIVGNTAWKISATKKAKHRNLYQGILKRSIYGNIARFIELLEQFYPPLILRLQDSGSRGCGTHLLVPLSHGNKKIFDLKNDRVVSFYSHRKAEQLKNSQELLETYYPISSLQFRNHSEENIVVESLINGPNYNESSRAQQLHVIDVLIQGASKALNNGDIHYWSDDEIESICMRYRSSDIPSRWSSFIDERMMSVRQNMKNLPLIPCHLDLHVDNILFGPEGPQFIDIMTADRYPAFFDMLSLVINAYCHDIENLLFDFIRDGNPSYKKGLINSIFGIRCQDTLLATFIVIYLSRADNHLDQWRCIDQLENELNIVYNKGME